MFLKTDAEIRDEQVDKLLKKDPVVQARIDLLEKQVADLQLQLVAITIDRQKLATKVADRLTYLEGHVEDVAHACRNVGSYLGELRAVFSY